MAKIKKDLCPSEIYFKEFGKRDGKQRIYQEYLDYRLTLPISTEHILNEGIRIFKESTDDTPENIDVQWKLFGSLLLATYEFPICDDDSVIGKLRKSNISSKQLRSSFGLKIPSKKLKLVSCAPVYVDYFKGLFDEIDQKQFPIDGDSKLQLSPEKVFYGLMGSIQRPQKSLEIKDRGTMGEETYEALMFELEERDAILDNLDAELMPTFIWTSQKLGYTKAESIEAAKELLSGKQYSSTPISDNGFTNSYNKRPMVLK